MAVRSHEDRLSRLWGPAVRAVLPGERLRREQAIDRAVGRDGKILADAIPADANRIANANYTHAGASTASTTVWSTAATIVTTLPPGTWRVTAKFVGRIGNTLGSSVHTRLNIGTYAGTTQSNTAPSAAAAPAIRVEQQLALAGEQTYSIVVQVKSVTDGTSTISSIALEYEAVKVA